MAITWVTNYSVPINLFTCARGCAQPCLHCWRFFTIWVTKEAPGRNISCKLSRCESASNQRWLVYQGFTFLPEKKSSLYLPASLVVECNKVTEYWTIVHRQMHGISGPIHVPLWQGFILSFLRCCIEQGISRGMLILWETVHHWLEGSTFHEKLYGVETPSSILQTHIRLTMNKKEIFTLLSQSECPFVCYLLFSC